MRALLIVSMVARSGPQAWDNRAGLGRLAREHVAVVGPLGASTPLKVECLVAGMLLGADSIEDMNRLRDGALTSVIG